VKRKILSVLALTVLLVGGYSVFVHRAAALTQQNTASSRPSDTLGQELVQESRQAAGEDETDQFKHSPAVQMVARLTGLSLEHAYWLCLILNFAIVAVVIVWAMGKNLPGTFRNRTASIQRAMEEARKSSEEAQRRLAEIENRLSRLDGEISQMRTAAEGEAAEEEKKIKAAAEEDARKIAQQTGQEIDAAVKSARRELKAYAADLAVTLAQQQMRIDSNTDQMLVKKFSQQLANTNGGSAKGSS
jgi:F-type H+-transporting ATPase subunit b